MQNNQVAIYQIHYGSISGQYDHFVETTTSTTSIQGLQPRSTYYFAVCACDNAKTNCSGFSNEVDTTIAVPEPAPAASYTTNATAGTAPFTVLFTDTSTGTITARNWQFGDGGSDTFVASIPIVVQSSGSTGGNGSDGSNDSSDDGSDDNGSDDGGTGNVHDPPPIDFNDHTLVSYPGQDLAGGAVIEDGGNTLRLTGNTWKRLAYPYTITGSTVIEFDYRSDLTGEFHEIAFDDGESTPSASHVFLLEGTQSGGPHLQLPGRRQLGAFRDSGGPALPWQFRQPGVSHG